MDIPSLFYIDKMITVPFYIVVVIAVATVLHEACKRLERWV